MLAVPFAIIAMTALVYYWIKFFIFIAHKSKV